MGHKITSVVLTVLLLFVLFVPASAASEEVPALSISAQGEADVMDPILNLKLPMDLPFVLDPYEVNKQGTLYSKEFVVENLSQVDVWLTFETIDVVFANDVDFKALTEPFGPSEIAPEKSVYLEILFGDEVLLEEEESTAPPAAKAPAASATDGEEDKRIHSIVATDPDRPEMEPILLKAAHFNANGEVIAPSEQGRLIFRLSGSINPEPEVDWSPGDVKISIGYLIRAARNEASEGPDTLGNEGKAAEESSSSFETPAEAVATPADAGSLEGQEDVSSGEESSQKTSEPDNSEKIGAEDDAAESTGTEGGDAGPAEPPGNIS